MARNKGQHLFEDLLAFVPAKSANHQETIYPARDKPAHRQLRGSRAAIGSEGKKARPF